MLIATPAASAIAMPLIDFATRRLFIFRITLLMLSLLYFYLLILFSISCWRHAAIIFTPDAAAYACLRFSRRLLSRHYFQFSLSPLCFCHAAFSADATPRYYASSV